MRSTPLGFIMLVTDNHMVCLNINSVAALTQKVGSNRCSVLTNSGDEYVTHKPMEAVILDIIEAYNDQV